MPFISLPKFSHLHSTSPPHFSAHQENPISPSPSATRFSFLLHCCIFGFLVFSYFHIYVIIMGQQQLIYSFVARGTMILAEYTEFKGNFTSIASQCLQKLPASSNKFTYNCDGHTFNYLVENGFSMYLNFQIFSIFFYKYFGWLIFVFFPVLGCQFGLIVCLIVILCDLCALVLYS